MSSGRIRTIKPELLEDGATAGLTHAGFRLYVGAILLADDYGNFHADPRQLRGKVFWGREDEMTTSDVASLVIELWAAGRTTKASGLFYLYAVRNQLYGHIRNWEKHQKIDHPRRTTIPSPSDEESEEYRPTPKTYGLSRTNPSLDLEDDQDQDQDQDQRPGPRLRAAAPRSDVPGQPTREGTLPTQPPSNPSTEPSTPNAPSPPASQLTLSTGQPEPADATGDAVQKVYEHYVAAWKRHIGGVRAPKLDEKRRKAIRARLREKFTVAELQQACDGVFLSPFHMGQNDSAKKYTDVELVCRDAKHVEQFMRVVDEIRPPRPVATAIAKPEPEPEYVPMPPEARAALAALGADEDDFFAERAGGS